jgi:hypothetical protein
MSQTKEKLAAQLEFEIRSAARALSVVESSALQARVEQAFGDLLEQREKSTPRTVARKYFLRYGKFAPLYRKLNG